MAGGQQEVDKRWIVERAVHVGSHALAADYATVGLAVGFCKQRWACRVAVGRGYAVVYLVSVHCAAAVLRKGENRLFQGLFLVEPCAYRQQAQSFCVSAVALYAVWVGHGCAHHLVAAAYSEYRLAVASGLGYSFGHAVTAQAVEIGQRVLAARQYYYVGIGQLAGSVAVEKVYARVVFKRVEVGEIADVPQFDDGRVHPSVVRRARPFGVQLHTVFLFYVYVVEVRHYAEHGHLAYVFEYLHAVVEQADVAPELVHYYSFYQLAVVFALQHDRTVGRGEQSAAFNVGNEHYCRPGVACHAHVYNIAVAQVELRNAARPFHYYW